MKLTNPLSLILLACASLIVSRPFCSIGSAQEASAGGVGVADRAAAGNEPATASTSSISVEPLSREQIDIFFDSLRASSPYTPPPVRLSQKVDATTSGIWAGTVFDPVGEVEDITLRFRPSVEERLKRAEGGGGVGELAEFVDLRIRLVPKGIHFSHSMAKDPLMVNGFLSPLKLDARGTTRTAFVRGVQDSGMYLSVPPMLSMEAAENWGVLVCPRAAQIVKGRSTGQMQLELSSSPYELSEIKMAMTANASARLPTLNSKERLRMRISTTGNVPPSTVAEDEEISVSPSLQVAYHPSAAPDFFRFAPHTSSQQGIRVMSETENQAGHIRRAYFDTTLYIQKLMEPSPVSVVINGARVGRDEGACYVVQRRKTRWAEYERAISTK